MQIKIENFGPIKSFDFDLDKDFHVIYGKNNIGKSYAISLVYVILKSIIDLKKDLENIQLLAQYVNQSNPKVDELIKNLNKKLEKNQGDKIIFIKSDFQNVIKELLNRTLLPDLRESFKNSFSDEGNIQNSRTNEKFEITLNFKYLKINIRLDKNRELSIIDVEYLLRCSVEIVERKRKVKPPGKDGEWRFYWKKNEISTEQLKKDIANTCFQAMSNAMSSKHIDDLFFLPAGRSGLYEGMNVFSLVFAKLSQSRNALNEKIEIPALSEPTSNYFLNLSNIDSSVKKDIYSKFASEIEKDILDAEIIFNDHKKRLEYFNPKLKLKLDLSETSSMVSEIAPIVAHLKYIIKENKNTNGHTSPPSKIIFIEEPEAHLHPEIQVKLIDIFTRLINHNIKIVLTTHSNYIFNKVNNLILANELSTEKIANYHIVQTDEGSIVKDEENLTNAGITDDNFADVAQKLYNERLEILHQD